MEEDTGELMLWPNPNSGGLVHLTIPGLDDMGEVPASITVRDLFGKQTHSSRSVVSGDVLNTVIDLGHCAAGVYLVNISVGERSWTERLVVQ